MSYFILHQSKVLLTFPQVDMSISHKASDEYLYLPEERSILKAFIIAPQ